MGRPKGGRGGQNTFGALKAKLTRHANEYIKEAQEQSDLQKRKEIDKNKIRWGNIIDKLKIEDKDFDDWYDNFSEIPDYIYWTGESFEVALKVLKKRLNKIRQEKHNDKAKGN